MYRVKAVDIDEFRNSRDRWNNLFSSLIIYPLWDIKDHSHKLKYWRGLEDSQWIDNEELRERQILKLRDIIRYSYANCPYYNAVFNRHNIDVSKLSLPDHISNIPILTKKDIQENVDGLISNLYNKDSLISAKTGGSTGKALRLYFDKRCEEMRNAAAMRSDRWAGWDLGIKMGALWGNPPIADTLKKKIRRALLDRLIYLDTMNLNDGSMSAFVEEYRRYKPEIIFGHSHSIFIFAKFIRNKGISDIKPRGIISTSMMLMPHEREMIEEVFQCKVANRYGCEEVGLIACECEEHNGMHLNIDHLYVEFIKEDGTPAKPGEEGAIVITDLINHGMPLIRYKVEDVGVPSDRKCACGRGLPLMERVAGRVADFLLKKDGSLVAGVSLIERTLTAIRGIEQMQIIQDRIYEIKLNIVKNEIYDAYSEKMLTNEIAKVFGDDIALKINYVDKIQQERSGKYRFSICNIKNSYVD